MRGSWNKETGWNKDTCFNRETGWKKVNNKINL